MTSSPMRPETDAIPLPPLTDGPHRKRIGYDTGAANGAESPMDKELGPSTFTEGVHA